MTDLKNQHTTSSIQTRKPTFVTDWKYIAIYVYPTVLHTATYPDHLA